MKSQWHLNRRDKSDFRLHFKIYFKLRTFFEQGARMVKNWNRELELISDTRCKNIYRDIACEKRGLMGNCFTVVNKLPNAHISFEKIFYPSIK